MPSSRMREDQLSQACRRPEREHRVFPVPRDVPQVLFRVASSRIMVEESLGELAQFGEDDRLAFL